ncbi:LysR family transcriptional regulator [Paenibacillus kobensis]|uniref:LysR family transcriptional regulator n=1 Tax=Paenibacillus kobensis TaxID=59841 RepID=UPI000FDBAB04|nr:LysR family transcriptional regulator [Paenibacillus kobensis]
MDFAQLEAFLAVRQTLNFTKAAEHLFISQSAITARIKALELTVGKPLFARDNRNVRLTQAGLSFYPYAERMVQLYEESKLTLSEQFDQYIVLSGPGAVWHHRYLKHVIAFRRSHPTIALKIFSYIDAEYMIRDLLLDGIVHIAVRFDPHEHPRITNIPLFEDELVLVSAQEGLQVERDDFFSPNYCHAGFDIPDWFESIVGPGYIPSMQLDHTGIIVTLMLKSEMFGFLSRTAVQPYLDEKKLFLAEHGFEMPKIRGYATVLTEQLKQANVKLGLSMLGIEYPIEAE